MESLVDPEFWKNRRVLLTGHTGFKGSWLALWLERLGAKVTGYALSPPTCPSLFVLGQIGAHMDSREGDIRDLNRLQAILTQSRPEVVFHLAAQSLVRESYRDPIATFATNVMGTVHTLEAARRAGGVRAIVNVTSDKCYLNKESGREFTEEDPLGGDDPYSSSKGCAELVTRAYQRSFFSETDGPSVASARAGNVIGGGDWANDRLLPDLVRGAIANQPIRIRNPRALRPWQYVLDALSGYLLLAQHLFQHREQFSGAWNFGPCAEDVKPVSWVVETFTRLYDRNMHAANDTPLEMPEAATLKLDSTKARTLLGWNSRMHIEEAMERTVGWYLCFRDRKDDLRDMTLREIAEYQARAGTNPSASDRPNRAARQCR